MFLKSSVSLKDNTFVFFVFVNIIERKKKGSGHTQKNFIRNLEGQSRVITRYGERNQITYECNANFDLFSSSVD